jgi:hypothetical protein
MATFVGVGWRTCKPGSGTGMVMRSATAANGLHVLACIILKKYQFLLELSSDGRSCLETCIGISRIVFEVK